MFSENGKKHSEEVRWIDVNINKRIYMSVSVCFGVRSADISVGTCIEQTPDSDIERGLAGDVSCV